MKKKTTEEFKKDVKKLYNDEYEVLGEYVNNKTKILIKHKKCGFIWETRPDNFLNNNTRCNKCYGTKKKTTEEFKKEVFNLVGEEYTVLGEYINCHEKILLLHNKCGNNWYVKPNLFLSSNTRCNKCCIPNKKKTTEEFKKEVFNLVGEEYTVLGEYNGCNKHIKMKHNNCNRTWLTSPMNFLSNKSRCPYCSRINHNSKAEKEIKTYLNKYKIKFEEEVSFKDCIYKNKLFFDFKIYLDEKNFFFWNMMENNIL